MAKLTVQSAQAQGSRAESEEAIRQLEQRLVETAVHNDWQFWERTVAPEWTGIDPFGRQWDKAAILSMLKNPQASIQSARLYDVQVRFVTDTIAIVTGTVTETIASTGGKTASLKARSTDILAYRAGKWLVVASQATPIMQGL